MVDGTWYDGEFVDNKKEGFGKITICPFDCWKEKDFNYKNYIGLMKGIDGKIRSGIWDNNRKVNSGKFFKIFKWLLKKSF